MYDDIATEITQAQTSSAGTTTDTFHNRTSSFRMTDVPSITGATPAHAEVFVLTRLLEEGQLPINQTDVAMYLFLEGAAKASFKPSNESHRVRVASLYSYTS